MVYVVLCPILGGIMNNKIVKTVDEHNIDRDANVMFAFDLEGSEYVAYRISRDEEQDNLFVSKVLKNLDGTFNMINVDDSTEKSKLNSIVMGLVESSVKSSADKLPSDTLSLSDGKLIKFISVIFNKEQKIEVRKTYVTTVKKEVSRVAEKYYDIVVVKEEPKVVEDIFPTVTPVVDAVVSEPVIEPATVVEPVVVESPVLTVPVVETPKVEQQVTTPVSPVVEVVTPIVSEQPVIPVVDPATVSQPSVSVSAPVSEVTVSVPNTTVVQPTPVVAAATAVIPEPVPTVLPSEPQPLVFDASKETNLNAALGEVASAETIPVENIAPVREFGVDTPTQTTVNPQPAVAPVVQPETVVVPKKLTKKAGFANSKFFMLVAIAFFLASCIFLGYEVFNYFQITK